VTLASASVVVTIVQEFRSERVLTALRDLKLELSVQQRIGAVIHAYEEQGFHRTAQKSIEIPPNAAAAGAFGDARRQNRHQAIVVITRGARPGFCPRNADSFLRPFGPPLLQVASEKTPFLVDCATGGPRRGDGAG
jgi:hypothetical protein